MDGERATRPPTTEIEIFGGVYHVKGRDDEGYLQELARRVDATMREVAERVTTVDKAKIAILAALNLADQLEQCHRRLDGERVEIEERMVALAAELGEALGS